MDEAVVDVPSLHIPVAAPEVAADGAASDFFLLLLDEVPMSEAGAAALESAGASDLVLVLLLLLLDAAESEVVDAAAPASAAAPYHFLTPSCPLQAPLFEAAEVQVPSLHMPVVPAGAAAGAFASAIVLHKSIDASTVRLVFLSMQNPPKDDETE